MAEVQGHPVEGTWVAGGSNGILTQLLSAYGGPDRRALTFEPTYLLHARLCWLTHTSHVAEHLGADFLLTDAQVERARAAGPDVVFVCSPNNPTGNAQPVEVTRALAEALPRALVIVDEAYVEFGGETALPLVATHPNVVVARTFSKAFAMAGARLGYVLAAPEVVEDLQRVRLPYHLSALAQAAGLVALRHREAALDLLDAIRTQRDRMVAALSAVGGVTVFPSDANFVLFIPPGEAVDVWQGLLDRGVLVRDLTAVVPNALRVTAGTEHETDLFLKAIEEVLGRMTRSASVTRTTKETDVRVELAVDGAGAATADTGIPFFDHMLQQLGKHAGFDLSVTCRGDLEIDGHHTVEDCGLAMGQALAEALGDKAGIRRFASITVPLDEAAVEAVLDLAGRHFVVYEVDVPAETINGFDTGLLEDFVRAFAQAADLTVHLRLRAGRSPHHVCEATFKALANALGDACRPTGRETIPSTKGVL